MAKKRRRPAKKPVPSVKPKTVKAKSAAKSQTAKASSPVVLPATQSVKAGEYAYVGREVRQILMITGFFVALQIGLWVALGQTGLAQRLTSLIRI